MPGARNLKSRLIGNKMSMCDRQCPHCKGQLENIGEIGPYTPQKYTKPRGFIKWECQDCGKITIKKHLPIQCCYG